ncbi:DEKNAAC102262 [Brettanomyces naardenensis]|uniref:DEKNAAC102262 n=1 Tax=Brettanomyces naardenensis TaxID=13370 RepID=A0A448YKL6_BRENA|nr:DEKNAAC102262 [Brettanomyces naardenensis]
MERQTQQQDRSSSGRQQGNNNNNNNNNNGGRRRRDRFEGPKRDAILKLENYLNTDIIVTLSGGREVVGKLTGYDQLMNIVLEDTVERLRDVKDRTRLTDNRRNLGRVIIRGPLLLTISPKDGFEVISNPFTTEESEETAI